MGRLSLLLIRTSLHHCWSLFPGNGILEGRDSGAEKARHIQPIGQQRQKPRTKTRKFGAICTTPGNLCLYGTAWWDWEDSNFQPNDYQFLTCEVPEVSSFATGALSPDWTSMKRFQRGSSLPTKIPFPSTATTTDGDVVRVCVRLLRRKAEHLALPRRSAGKSVVEQLECLSRQTCARRVEDELKKRGGNAPKKFAKV